MDNKKIKYKVLDLFCGAGGLSLGFQMAGFDIVGGIDFDKAAIDTHKANFKNTIDYCGDIKDITDKEIKKNYGEVDLIIGGPPCQGFSSANRRILKENDEKNKLFFEYLRFIKILKPKVFVIENVKEILTKNDGFAKNQIISITTKLGYDVQVDILNAVDYGVPQQRKRALFVGINKSFKEKFDFNSLKKEKRVVTVSDAISDIESIENYVMKNLDCEVYSLGKPKTEYQKKMRNKNNTLHNHIVYYPAANVQKMMTYVKEGENWKSVPENLFKSHRDNRYSNYLRRIDSKLPSITIDTGHYQYFHPHFNRVPTIREAARIQSFPDSFIFTGNKGQKSRQVGNAVPPLLSFALAKAILEVLKKHEET